jgi:nitrile hydratase
VNGVHDVGGMHGFGRVDHDPDEPAFHDEWERRAFASFVATLGQGLYTMDDVRHSIERMEPAHYLSAPYYEKWLTGMERLLVEADVLSSAEIVERAEAFERGEARVPDRNDPELVTGLRAGMAEAYETGSTLDGHRFEPGDRVRVRNIHPGGHTRVPRYVRGMSGTVRAVLGTFSFPDAGAAGEDESHPVYNVGFDQYDLWGDDGEGDELLMDLWEPYLEPAANTDDRENSE